MRLPSPIRNRKAATAVFTALVSTRLFLLFSKSCRAAAIAFALATIVLTIVFALLFAYAALPSSFVQTLSVEPVPTVEAAILGMSSSTGISMAPGSFARIVMAASLFLVSACLVNVPLIAALTIARAGARRGLAASNASSSDLSAARAVMRCAAQADILESLSPAPCSKPNSGASL